MIKHIIRVAQGVCGDSCTLQKHNIRLIYAHVAMVDLPWLTYHGNLLTINIGVDHPHARVLPLIRGRISLRTPIFVLIWRWRE